MRRPPTALLLPIVAHSALPLKGQLVKTYITLRGKERAETRIRYSFSVGSAINPVVVALIEPEEMQHIVQPHELLQPRP